jgi:hypothetical protein
LVDRLFSAVVVAIRACPAEAYASARDSHTTISPSLVVEEIKFSASIAKTLWLLAPIDSAPFCTKASVVTGTPRNNVPALLIAPVFADTILKLPPLPMVVVPE